MVLLWPYALCVLILGNTGLHGAIEACTIPVCVGNAQIGVCGTRQAVHFEGKGVMMADLSVKERNGS